MLLEEPPPYLIVDGGRLRATWAYRGEFADVLTGATATAFNEDLVQVLRPIAPEEWSAAARKACAGSLTKRSTP